MAEPAELAQLKDIHLPPAISWWPLAHGWHLLMALAVVLILLAVHIIRKRRAYARPKKLALNLLNGYAQQQADTQMMCAQVSELLRRVALVYFPREDVAGLHGDAWLEFLNRTGKKINFSLVKHLLLEAPFNIKAQDDVKPLIQTAKLWIKQRKKPCLN